MSVMRVEKTSGSSIIQERTYFLLRSLPLLAAVLGCGAYLADRFHLGIDDQKELCLPGEHRWFVIDRHDQNIWRGGRVAFRADERMAPWFPLGRVVIKIATGVTGDWVRVDDSRTSINGETVSEGLALTEKLGKTTADLSRNETVPAGAYWVTGTHPKSFDSRYWGFVYERQVIGKAYVLPF